MNLLQIVHVLLIDLPIMPFRTPKTNGSSISQFAPPYTVTTNEFSGLSTLTVPYRTTYESMRYLVLEEFELADKPMVSDMFIDYEINTVNTQKVVRFYYSPI